MAILGPVGSERRGGIGPDEAVRDALKADTEHKRRTLRDMSDVTLTTTISSRSRISTVRSVMSSPFPISVWAQEPDGKAQIRPGGQPFFFAASFIARFFSRRSNTSSNTATSAIEGQSAAFSSQPVGVIPRRLPRIPTKTRDLALP